MQDIVFREIVARYGKGFLQPSLIDMTENIFVDGGRTFMLN